MMNKVLQVAQREIVATVATKGFILGVLLTPGLIVLMMLVFPLFQLDKTPRVVGEVAIIDPTSAVADGVRSYLTPEAFALRRAQTMKAVDANLPPAVKSMASARGGPELPKAAQALLGQVPELHLRQLASDSSLEQEKQALTTKQGGPGRRLALIVIQPDAVQRLAGKEKFGTYRLYIREKLDDRVEGEIKAAVRGSIIAARMKSSGLDPKAVDQLTDMPSVQSTSVTGQGEKESLQVLTVMLPAAFMFLLFMSVMTAGQYLMTTTIEEKSSRIAEVLLSAVSPMELMGGKIIGQFTVGLIVLFIYGGLGIAALLSFALLGFIEGWMFFYLFVFYLIAFFTFASLMAAVGASVNEMREAQTLLMPIMLTMMLPMLLWLPISRDPSSSLAVALSFVPPVNTYVMLLRMGSNAAPPIWQVWVSIAIGIAGAYACVWAAAKVFRIGLLMHGKPPDFRTLVRWVRMA